MQRLLPKQQDPVLGTLAGSDNASGSGSNVKGCLAREAFQRTIQDLQRVAMLSPDECHEGAGLWTRPGGFFTHAAVCGTPDSFAGVSPSVLGCYNAGRELGDWLRCSRQAADGFDFQDAAVCRADSSRWGQDPTELAPVWNPEPASHLLMSSRKKPGLEPFARLCPAPWVAANLSYLRDLDYMETRMAALGKPNRSKAALSDEEKDPKPKAKATPKAKGRGKGGGKQTAEPAETPAMG